MNKFGRRPAEFASKAAHSHLVRDEDVQGFLRSCRLPEAPTQGALRSATTYPYSPVQDNPVKTIVTIDGGFTEVAVRSEFPSSTICFFQFGVLFFRTEDLETLRDQAFIDPEDMAKLKQIQRLKLTLPIRYVTYGGERTLTHSVRRALHEFFSRDIGGSTLLDTLRWLIFAEYRGAEANEEWVLATSPYTEDRRLPLRRGALRPDGTWVTPHGPLYLTDVLRLHEAIDDELGAGGILAYVTTSIEQILIAHVVRLALRTKPDLLRHLLIIKDGPLAFFGQTARLHEPMRDLVRYLFEKHELFLAGLEKSGAFVEHAHAAKGALAPGTALILDNDYIYRYVIPGSGDPAEPYGRTTYYGAKLIFKTSRGGVHVVTVPTVEAKTHPGVDDLRNLDVILTTVEKLRCDMYDDALMPVALANKLVSLSNRPSAKVLQQFATGAISP